MMNYKGILFLILLSYTHLPTVIHGYIIMILASVFYMYGMDKALVDVSAPVSLHAYTIPQ